MPRPATTKPPASRPDFAYLEIRRRILDSHLPAGAPLSELQLAAELNVSRTPIRQALQRLAQEGLVNTVSNRGAFVAGVAAQDVVEIYEIREQLESYAAAVAAREMTDVSITELERQIAAARAQAERGDLRAAFDSDIRLHEQIVAATGNARMVQILATLKDQVHRIRIGSGQDRERLLRTIVEHELIIEAISRRDEVGAREAMAMHLRAARDNALRISLKIR